MAQTEESVNVFYLQQLCSDLQQHVFKTPWGSVLIQNCDDNGKLIDYKSVQDFKNSGKSLWLNLKLVLFRKDSGVFPVWCCPQCPSMQGFSSMGVQHNEEDLQRYLCMHSKAASFLLPNWETIWNVGLDPGVGSHEVVCNDDINVVTCKEYIKGQLFLAAVRTEGKVHILYTITKRQTAPLCSTYPAPFCSTQKCKHFRKYEEIVNTEGFTELFDPTFGRNLRIENEFDHHDRNTEEAEDIIETEATEETGETEETEERDHYMREPTKAEFSKMCGYNFSKIPYPFKRSKSMQSTWVKRQKHGYDFPESFIPEYSEDNTCELHGHRYDENDDNLIVDLQQKR